uniref:Porin domain-containing protein n=1 Tax=uncultured Thiotrichaceae bacterium TaxID=298394 RepID=A0A6S6TH75_9GAMM|nr:MAG: Unknown protein [uncultured Thiotrichaceae bacterium]
MAKILGVAVVMGMLMSASAYAEPVVFGQVRADYGFVDDGSGKHYRFDEHGSRLGLKGAAYFNPYYEFTYIVEGESDIASSDEVFNEVRQAWLGVRNKAAEIRVGRHLSPARVSVTAVDLFTNQEADQRKILESDKVLDKSVVYLNRAGDFAYAVALSADSANEHTATDFLINYNNENTYVAAAYLKGYDQQRISRLAATYLLPAGHRVGLAFEYLDDKNNVNHTAYVVNAAYQLDEQKRLKLQYGRNQSSAGGRTETLLGVGVDFDLSDNTVLQFQYSTNRHMDHGNEHEKSATVGITYDF